MALKRSRGHINLKGSNGLSLAFFVVGIAALLLRQGSMLLNLSGKIITTSSTDDAPFSSRLIWNSLSGVQGASLHAQDSDKTRPCKPGTKLSATLVIFGVPKSFRIVWRSYFRNIVERNPHVDFEVHLHMYSDLLSVNTPRNWEINAVIDTHEKVQTILYNAEDISTKIITSSQAEFDTTLLSWLNKSNTLYDLDIHSTMNVFRQGNSMKEAFLSASGQTHLNSTKDREGRCGYDMVYLFMRSDTLLLSPIDIPHLGLDSKDIHIPLWQSWVGVTYNDRFALAGSLAANIYAASKSVAFKEMVLDKKEKNEALEQLGTPERMLRLWLDKNSLNITVVPDWAKLVRIRGDGRIPDRDAGEFKLPQKNVQDLSYAWTPLASRL